MPGRLPVTIETCRRKAFEPPRSMTGCTTGFLMFSQQGESSLIMVESDHGISAIMTIEAVLPKVRSVPCHESRILTSMAIRASMQRNRVIHRINMAGGTLHWLEGIIDLMPDETESSDGMIEFMQRISQWRKIAPLVIRMALITADDINDATVQPLPIKHLGRNPFMTG